MDFIIKVVEKKVVFLAKAKNNSVNPFSVYVNSKLAVYLMTYFNF